MRIDIGKSPKLARRTVVLTPAGEVVENAVAVDTFRGTIDLLEPRSLGDARPDIKTIDGTGYRVEIEDLTYTLQRSPLQPEVIDAVMLALHRVLGAPHDDGEAPVDVTEAALRDAVTSALHPFMRVF